MIKKSKVTFMPMVLNFTEVEIYTLHKGLQLLASEYLSVLHIDMYSQSVFGKFLSICDNMQLWKMP